MCHLYGPQPRPRRETTDEDRERAAEWIQSAYEPKGRDASEAELAALRARVVELEAREEKWVELREVDSQICSHGQFCTDCDALDQIALVQRIRELETELASKPTIPLPEPPR